MRQETYWNKSWAHICTNHDVFFQLLWPSFHNESFNLQNWTINSLMTYTFNFASKSHVRTNQIRKRITVSAARMAGPILASFILSLSHFGQLSMAQFISSGVPSLDWCWARSFFGSGPLIAVSAARIGQLYFVQIWGIIHHESQPIPATKYGSIYFLQFAEFGLLLGQVIFW